MLEKAKPLQFKPPEAAAAVPCVWDHRHCGEGYVVAGPTQLYWVSKEGWTAPLEAVSHKRHLEELETGGYSK